MRGFNTKKAQSCKDGGLIRGPGTGTSDSIPRGFKPGTFIMPADSTKAIGPDVLENIAKVPTKVSNGEFAHTPQEVHAVGINTLRQMKDATHNPKNDGVYFANGGQVRDPNRPDIPVVGTRGPVLGGGGGGLSREAVAQAQRPQAPQPAKYGVGALPANPVTQPGLILQDRERKAQGFASGGEVRGFKPEPQRLYGGGGVLTKEDQALSALRRARDAQPVGSPNIAAIDQSIAQRNQSIGGAASALSAMAAPFQKPVQTVAPNPTDMRLSANTQATPMESQAPEVMTDAQRGGAAPAVQVPSLSQQAAQPAPAQPVAQALAQVPSLAPVQAQGFQAPSVRHSGNNWKSENDLRNLRVSASSIMNNGGRWDQHGRGVVSPERAAYMQALQTDAALQGEEVKGQQQAMAQAQGNERAAMQQTGENQRASLRELGFQSRDQRKAGMDERALAMQETAAGFSTRAAAQAEQLRGVLLDPSSTPAQRQAAQQAIIALSGKESSPKDSVVTLGGGQEWDSNAGAMRNVPQRAIDLRTGQEIGGKQAAAVSASPYSDGQELKGKDGKTYVVKNGVPVLK